MSRGEAYIVFLVLKVPIVIVLNVFTDFLNCVDVACGEENAQFCQELLDEGFLAFAEGVVDFLKQADYDLRLFMNFFGGYNAVVHHFLPRRMVGNYLVDVDYSLFVE